MRGLPMHLVLSLLLVAASAAAAAPEARPLASASAPPTTRAGSSPLPSSAAPAAAPAPVAAAPEARPLASASAPPTTRAGPSPLPSSAAPAAAPAPSAGSPSSAAPSPAAETLSPLRFRKIVERVQGAALRVVVLGAAGGWTTAGTAGLVGVGGELLAAAALVRDGRLVVEYRGERLEAVQRQRVDDIGIALLSLPPGTYPAASVGAAARLSPGTSLVGLSFDARGRLAANPARFKSVSREPDRPPGLKGRGKGMSSALLFSPRGELVGIRVPGKNGVVPIETVRQRMAPGEPQ